MKSGRPMSRFRVEAGHREDDSPRDRLNGRRKGRLNGGARRTANDEG